jgi:hypothetical protein
LLTQMLGQGGPGNPGASEDHEPSDKPQKQTLDESGLGASPYGLFNAPEPVTAADTDFRGLVKKDNFLRLANHHFTLLDQDGAGYLTLAKLPKTLIQQKLEKIGHHRS